MFFSIIAKNINTSTILEDCQVDEFLYQENNDQKIYYNINTEEFDLIEIDKNSIEYVEYKLSLIKSNLMQLIDDTYENRKSTFKIIHQEQMIDFSLINMRASDLKSFIKTIISEADYLAFPRYFHKVNLQISSLEEATTLQNALIKFIAIYFNVYINPLYTLVNNLTLINSETQEYKSIEDFNFELLELNNQIIGIPEYILNVDINE